MTAHVLDHAVRFALTGRHAGFALVEGGARRYDSAHGVFASLAESSDESLAGLRILVEIVSPGAADAPEMLALATRTEPGPFCARTHLLGDFFGVKVAGQLVAMACELLKPRALPK